VPFNKKPGNWNFVSITNQTNKPLVAIGNYQGISIFEKTTTQLIPFTTVPSFNESSRYLVADSFGNLWVSHPYHGVFRISLIDSVYKIKRYAAENGVPAPLNNQVYLLNQEIVLATEKGIYKYVPNNDKFIPHPQFEKTIGKKGTRYINRDKSGNYWFVQAKTVGVINASDNTITYLPELANKILSGFESILPLDEQNIFISGEKGIFHVNYLKYKENIRPLKVEIRSLTVTNKIDSLIYGGFGEIGNSGSYSYKPSFESNWKTIRINYSSILFGQQSRLEYSYRLKGFENGWSPWTDKTEKEYTNLLEGKYIFEVKARNNLGNESSITSYSFTVLPPWYRTSWAYALYIILVTGLFVLMYQIQKRKFSKQKERIEEEKKRLLYIHELERNKAQNEIVSLQNEKLEAEINFKNSELASSTMHLVKKGELLSKIKDELSHALKNIDNKVAVQEIKKVIKSVSDDDKVDQEWDAFAKHFDKVHSDFVVSLKKKYATLTANEVKLCIYLRMNLSSKEIAQLMNISVRGVEISRYRLRKKIGIPSEVNLFDHLMTIDGNSASA
jgi:DNA-binding CsgD family transcriptional regulator